MSDDLLGYMLGPYEVVDTIGFEGPAEVYRGYQKETGKHVLIRLVGRGLEPNPVWSSRFRREGRAIATLKHANIAPAYDFGEALDGHYMISELVEGTTLTSILEQVKAGERTLAPDDITFMIRQVAAALDYAHAQGVTHRDLTPDHITITRSGQAIVTDFGLTMLLSRDTVEHTGGAYFGTASYMAPEVLEDFLTATHASDIYSLGVILYQILTGELPYQMGSEVDDALRVLTGSAPNPRLLNEDIPATVADVILKALSVSPKDRFRNAMQMAAKLEWAYANPNPPEPMPKQRRAPKPAVEHHDLVTDGPLPSPRRPTAERLVVKRSMSRQEERREKARLRAEHDRIRRHEDAHTRQLRRAEEAKQRQLKAQARRQQWRAFWARWGRTIATIAIVLVLLVGVLVSLQAAGVIAVAVKPPELPDLPQLPTPLGPTATSTPFDANVAIQNLTPTAPPAQAPTPLQPTHTPISPVQLEPLGVDTAAFRVHDGMAMQFVPAGQFLMGTNDPVRNPNARPQHPVMLADYWIDQTEVTNAQYALCVAKGLCKPPTKTIYYDDPAYADFPVTFLTYEQAGSYCLWLSSSTGQVVGLPSEAQWEKAAAWDPVAGEARLYPWGSEQPTQQHGRFFGGQETLPASEVGTHPQGASAYGVHDMAGNVWEWVADWFDEDYYKRTGVAVDPTGPTTGTHRVAKGGSWRLEGYMAISSFRNPTQPNVNGDALGFRCGMTAGRPPADSGVAIAPADAAQMLGILVQQSLSDDQNDDDTMSGWQDALSDLNTALANGDTQKATGIIVEYTQRLASHRKNNLISPALAFRLDRGMAWIQEKIAPVIP